LHVPSSTTKKAKQLQRQQEEAGYKQEEAKVLGS
jgi:hypothetical protein